MKNLILLLALVASLATMFAPSASYARGHGGHRGGGHHHGR